MRRRSRSEEAPFSLDSLLDIVTNVVGVLVLVAMVTVLSAGQVSVPSGVTAAAETRLAERALFECAHNQVFLLDEEDNQRRVLAAADLDKPGVRTGDRLARKLDLEDIGDANHRVRVEPGQGKLAWTYWLRPDARGEQAAQLDRPSSAFQRKLGGLSGGFAYFVVHSDSFEVFRRARELARARGIAVGWHPIEASEPVRLSARGSLGRRVQ